MITKEDILSKALPIENVKSGIYFLFDGDERVIDVLQSFGMCWASPATTVNLQLFKAK